MKIFLLLSVVLFFFTLPGFSQHKIAFTIDDLPVVAYRQNTPEQQHQITTKLVDTLRAYRVPCIGFVNEVKLYQENTIDSAQVNYLEMWLNRGLELGNHTFSHHNFHRVDFKTYTDDILRGEQITRELSQQHRRSFDYFRHPYLRIGKSKAAHDSLTAFLHEHGYKEAPVTIDNEDYVFALAYSKASGRGDQETMRRIRKAFVDYMEAKLLYYERQSNALFGRNISQILLLHASALNSDCLASLIRLYKRHGYEFVSLEEALADKAYTTPITKYGDYGISWIDRWALSQGKTGDFFKGEPETPQFIVDLSRQE